MRSEHEVGEVLSLYAEGCSHSEIARRTGVPRTTVRDWTAGRWPSHRPRLGRGCSRCGGSEHFFAEVPGSPYAYLLGAYLGDGYIARHHRGVHRLRISLDDRYPGIIDECQRAAQLVLPDNRVSVQRMRGRGCSEVGVYSKSLVCLFPQSGPGRKHERPMRLSQWQQQKVGASPESFLRGLIHTDGCRIANPVRHGARTYHYPRYCFSNSSADIKRLFCDTCDLLGIDWRVMNAQNISVARRTSVARLDDFIGPKA